jgi:hypothetical protein
VVTPGGQALSSPAPASLAVAGLAVEHASQGQSAQGGAETLWVVFVPQCKKGVAAGPVAGPCSKNLLGWCWALALARQVGVWWSDAS